MRGDTKTFIETNIELIEQQDWLTLFQDWYDTAYGELDADEIRFDDLLDTLYKADVIPFRGITFEARKQIIYKEVDLIIQDWIDNLDDWTGSPGWIGIYYITDQLRSHLGLDIDVVKEVVKTVASHKNLVYNADGFELNS